MSFRFKIEDTRLEGVKIIKYDVFNDVRGNIWTTYCNDLGAELENIGYRFIHDKFNSNKLNVFRGIHYDSKTAKLVTCVYGSIQQYVINVDQKSPNFGKYISVL